MTATLNMDQKQPKVISKIKSIRLRISSNENTRKLPKDSALKKSCYDIADNDYYSSDESDESDVCDSGNYLRTQLS